MPSRLIPNAPQALCHFNLPFALNSRASSACIVAFTHVRDRYYPAPAPAVAFTRTSSGQPKAGIPRERRFCDNQTSPSRQPQARLGGEQKNAGDRATAPQAPGVSMTSLFDGWPRARSGPKQRPYTGFAIHTALYVSVNLGVLFLLVVGLLLLGHL